MSAALEELMQRADALTTEEQLHLAEYLVGRARAACQPGAARRKWRELCGLAPYPLAGEDAQAWITRTRREADEQRGRQWGSAQ